MGEGDKGSTRAASAAALAHKLTLDDVPLAGRRVLVRADFNVPVADSRVMDDTRIVATVPTISRLIEAGARVILMSHRGRPQGAPDDNYSMRPVAARLAECLGVAVAASSDCVGAETHRDVDALGAGGVLLLENLRFHPGETTNDLAFAAELAGLGDVFVNDAFGVSHRSHASVVGVAGIVPVAVAGELLRLEIETLSRVLIDPARPFVLVLGGAKVSDKVAMVRNVLGLVDRIVIGGAMANAFLAAQGRAMGGSLAPADAVLEAAELLELAAAAGVDVVLPSDLVAATAIDAPDTAHAVSGAVAGDAMALDIGPDSRARFAGALAAARTVVWNGPMGVFEVAEFAEGTRELGAAITALGDGAFTVIGGGDTAAAASAFGMSQAVSHVSTGGGASLDLLSGVVLPGIAALTDRPTRS